MNEDYILSPGEGVSIFINPAERDLGEFTVRRFLPHHMQRKVGPFVFFDHMGPAVFAAGQGIDIRPHPHSCLATITYLFEGSIVHRDSLGYVQEILPGEVNWMTAGRGIVHSERTGAAARSSGQVLHGLQLWVALPDESEEVAPEFFHYEREAIPTLRHEHATMRLIAGSAFGETSPVRTYSRLFYLDVELPASATVGLPGDYSERGVYIISGSVAIAGAPMEAGTMAVLDEVGSAEITATRDSRLVMFGGDPITERYLEWNFVASNRQRIEQAKDDWRNHRFPIIEDDAEEFIPLPGEG